MTESPRQRAIFLTLLGTALGLTLFSMYWAFERAPLAVGMGVEQKIFYIHVPAAIAMEALFIVSGIASLVFVLKDNRRADALAYAAAEVGVVLAAFVLITGPLWARRAWGHYWEWEPRLTLTMVVLFLYVAYLALRSFGGDDGTSRRIAAGLAIAGMPAIYLVRVAVKLWRGTHPQVIFRGGLKDPNMLTAFLVGVVGMFILAILIVWVRYALERARMEVDAVAMEMMERDLLEEEL